MSGLFEVEGWNLGSKEIKTFVPPKKGAAKAKAKKAKADKKPEETKPATKAERPEKRVREADDEADEADKPAKKAAEPKPKKQKKNKTEKGDKAGKPTESPKAAPAAATEPAPALPVTQLKKLTPLQEKMQAKLSGSRFRWINEKLYTISSADAVDLIKQHPEMYAEYHSGFRSQVQSWPENPVNLYIARVQEMKRDKRLPRAQDGCTYFADMGCGDAEFAKAIATPASAKPKGRGRDGRIVVRSFDLAKSNERVEVADVRNVPVEDESMHYVIFCLALMGVNFLDFVREAKRILRVRGELWISEIKSRFSDQQGQEFVDAIKSLGFVHRETNSENKMFIRFEFFKPPEAAIKKPEEDLPSRGRMNKQKKKFIDQETDLEKKLRMHKEGEWLLKPCIYKRR
ncbi:methyltransferase-domain-containing protein [Dipodascopsis tothii]|uniref:methyltransferase-domain-containing protein n=1 Tax=Dipodascopsis tothii TaxID=44089 RepID=UPI0034CF3D83